MKRNILLAIAAGSMLLAGPVVAKTNRIEKVPFQLSSDAVMQIQQKLNDEGFNAGRADGVWTRKTSQALKQFQKQNNMAATGRLDRQTLADLGLNKSSNVNMSNRNTNNPNMGRSTSAPTGKSSNGPRNSNPNQGYGPNQ